MERTVAHSQTGDVERSDFGPASLGGGHSVVTGREALRTPGGGWWVARGSSVDVSHWRWNRPLTAGESGFERGLGRGDRGVGLVHNHTDE